MGLNYRLQLFAGAASVKQLFANARSLGRKQKPSTLDIYRQDLETHTFTAQYIKTLCRRADQSMPPPHDFKVCKLLSHMESLCLEGMLNPVLSAREKGLHPQSLPMAWYWMSTSLLGIHCGSRQCACWLCYFHALSDWSRLLSIAPNAHHNLPARNIYVFHN